MSQRANVIVTDFIADGLMPEKDILGLVADVTALDAIGEPSLKGLIEEADAIMMYHNITLRAESIRSLKRCKLIVRCGVGIDNVDWAQARRCSIPVANVPDYGTEEVADTAIGMLLSLTRGIHFLNSRLRERKGPWMYTQVAPLQRLRGRVLGIVGLGRIGTAAAMRGKSLGMDVCFYDPMKPDGYDKALGIRRAFSLEELLAQSFALSIHCPLTDKTRHCIDADAIARMPEGGFLVNTARGGIVDNSAIPAAIESGRLAGAGIDVLEIEPAHETDPLIAAWRNPLHPAHDRVIINPHSAFYSEQGLMEIRIKASQACLAALEGREIRNVVN